MPAHMLIKVVSRDFQRKCVILFVAALTLADSLCLHPLDFFPPPPATGQLVEPRPRGAEAPHQGTPGRDQLRRAAGHGGAAPQHHRGIANAPSAHPRSQVHTRRGLMMVDGCRTRRIGY